MSVYTCENNFGRSGAHLKAKETASLSIYKQALIFQKWYFSSFWRQRAKKIPPSNATCVDKCRCVSQQQNNCTQFWGTYWARTMQHFWLDVGFVWWNLLWAYSLSKVSDLAEELVVVAVLEKLCWTGWFDFVCGQPSVTGHAGNPDLRMDLVVMRSWCFCVFMDLQRRSGVQQEGVSSWHSCLQASETVFGFMGDIALTSPMPANLFIPEKTPVAHV